MHLCVSLDLEAWRYTIVVNSKVVQGNITNMSGSELVVRGGGLLLVGMEQDRHGGGFNIEQTYEGYLAGLLVFPKALSTKRIKEYLSCGQRRLDTAIVTFSSLEEEWELFGDTEIVSFKEEKLCGKPAPVHVMFPEPRTLEESQDQCHMLKGKLSAPQSAMENTAIVKETESRMEMCTISWGVYLWLGVRAMYRNNSWNYIDLDTNETMPYTNFRKGYLQAVVSYTCTYMDSFDTGKWSVYPCSLKTCAVCTFDKPSTLRLRGLCEDTVLDQMFLINGVRNGKPVFSGVGNTEIFWDNTTWVLTDLLQRDVTGRMQMTNLLQYPLGLRRWNITGDRCPSNDPDLLLTACTSKQYTCHDGTCIRKMQRCDLEVNCPDQSDERLCTPVVVPKDYINEVPPARVGTEPAWIHFHITILSMQPLDTLNMKLSVYLSLTMRWRDPRLDMESLNYAETLNVIHEDNIWRPELLFQDTTGTEAETKKQWETFVAVMESGPEPDDISRFKEDEVYPGETNSLKLEQNYWVQVSCYMLLEMYPFDTQTCSFIARLQAFTRDLVALKASNTTVEYRGATTLREYEMRAVEMMGRDWHNYSGREIRFRLDNLSGFYVSSTYVPTFLMVMICYLTFFFELDDFNDRIMVSLTALLVLATLFTQITKTTPNTSYLKLLDMWFVACILINFSIVMVLVVINAQRMRENTNPGNTVNMVMPFGAKKPPHPPPSFFPLPHQPVKSVKMNSFAQIVTPIILFILVMVYVGVSLQDAF
ncbi:Gamma-aminobutyric acid receptor subunit gamma-4 [Chionoecetes opilio]|uniref:Gamma-aminobutyric acid receptor subunit gamma-4 n=1 Tax=Chionoecetes opilio TaxID=41210 RepID=A0A8J4YG31_CHIOP|nr:Gamma-aminobutyric acid receptor subunit gamma-4 [Chionoecetes opilio]